MIANSGTVQKHVRVSGSPDPINCKVWAIGNHYNQIKLFESFLIFLEMCIGLDTKKNRTFFCYYYYLFMYIYIYILVYKHFKLSLLNAMLNITVLSLV